MLPQEEFLSLLGGASPLVHQFLVNTVGEVVYIQPYLGVFPFYMNVVSFSNFVALQGVKRISNVLSDAGKELECIVLDHLQVQQYLLICR